MAIRGTRKVFSALCLTGAGILFVSTVHAGPEVTLYLTVPLGGLSTGNIFSTHVFGLRLDKSTAPADVRVSNPESPLARRALMDLQMGANSALRLELARRLTWDINRAELHQSASDSLFSLRLPQNHGESRPPAEHSLTSLAAAFANPLQNPSGKSTVKGFSIEP